MLNMDEQYDKLRSLDHDLAECCYYNSALHLAIYDELLAIIEGQNDGEQWHWVLRRNVQQYVLISGWCDYTGWGCQDDMRYMVPYSRRDIDEDIACFFPNIVQNVYDSESKQWLKVNVVDFIRWQIENGVVRSWRKVMDSEFGREIVIDT